MLVIVPSIDGLTEPSRGCRPLAMPNSAIAIVSPPAAVEDRRNIHLDVGVEFHREVKLMCVYKGIPLRKYCVEAVKMRLESDNQAIVAAKKAARAAKAAKAAETEKTKVEKAK